MRKIISLILSLLLVICILPLSACNNSTSEKTILRICNCEDYIDEDLLTEFTELTGIEIEYSTYGTNENLYNELVINPNSYDLVVPSEYMIQKLAAEGRINKLDITKVPSYTQNVSPYIKNRLDNITFKQGNEDVKLSDFMVGYMWGTMGWVYNTNKVSIKEVSSWDGVFSNESLNKKITIKDSVRDSYLVGLALVYKEELLNATTNEEITEILNRVDSESINKVGEKLNSLKSKLYGFEVDSGKNDIVLGNIDAYVAWSGDAAYAIDVACGEVEDEDGSFVESTKSLSYYIPDEGSNIWFDGFVMPSGSNNYDAVYKFLDFISNPENVIRNMDYTGYTSMIGGDTIYEEIVLGWFDESEDLEDNEGVLVDLSYFFGEGEYTVKVSEEAKGRLISQYPTIEIASRCAVMNYFSNDTLMEINEMWEGVKGETFPLWLIILIFVLVLLLAVFMVLYQNRERIKWFKLPEFKTTLAERKGYKVISKEEINT